MFELVTGTDMKPRLSRNMLPNINTCENGWSNFSANLRVLSLKLLELTQLACPNLSIYFIFYVPFLAMTSSRVLVFSSGHLLSFHHGATHHEAKPPRSRLCHPSRAYATPDKVVSPRHKAMPSRRIRLRHPRLGCDTPAACPCRLLHV